eukprot:1037600-Pelagomonas_calceolata.AAC.3
MLEENVSPALAADQPDSRVVGQPPSIRRAWARAWASRLRGYASNSTWSIKRDPIVDVIQAS